MKTKVRYVKFFSPGILFSVSETDEVSLGEFLGGGFNLKLICAKAKTIEQRHGATPYSFNLREQEEGEVTVDGETYKSKPRVTFQSGIYFITGKVLTLSDIPATRENEILRSNMQCNHWNAVVENMRNGCTSVEVDGGAP
jgi:hypothetical protein